MRRGEEIEWIVSGNDGYEWNRGRESKIRLRVEELDREVV